MKGTIYIFLGFLISLYILIFEINNYFDNEKRKVLEVDENKIHTQFNIVINSLEQLANTSFRGFIKNKTNIREAFAKRNRELLYKLFEDDYIYLSSLGFKQIHFHLPNNHSFLRMHTPQIYGDNLQDIRYSVKFTNKYHDFISGIEVGKVLPGYRFVYPVFYNAKYIGSVEFSFGIEKIINDIEKMYDVHSHFLIKKELFEKKVLKEFRHLYKKSVEHRDFIELKRKNQLSFKYIYFNKKISQIAEKNINEKKVFTLDIKVAENQRHKSATFLPISNVENTNISYFVFYHNSKELENIEIQHFNKLILFSLLLILVFSIIFMLFIQKRNSLKSKQKLQKLLDTQENLVILSDGISISFANKKFFDYLTGVKDLSTFKMQEHKVYDFFVENDKFFHGGKIKENENWLDSISSLPLKERVVCMMGKDFNLYSFLVKINDFDEKSKIISFSDITQKIIEQVELEEKVMRDKLTGAFNREYFEQNYKHLIHKYFKDKHFFALAIVDIDHFKSVNDTFGHDVGDNVLKQFVNTIKKNTREEDILIRWGGEEFVLLLKVTSKENLFSALDNLRKIIELENFEIVQEKTCSIGGTIYKEGEEISSSLKRADEALYKAKNTGRNKVIIYE